MTTRGPRSDNVTNELQNSQVSANLKQARADDATAPARREHSAILNKLFALAGMLSIFPLMLCTETL